MVAEKEIFHMADALPGTKQSTEGNIRIVHFVLYP